MNKYRFFYMIFFVISAILLFAYKSKLTSVIFIFAAVMPLLSLLSAGISGALLKVKIEYRRPWVEKYEKTGITLKITNRFILPVSPAEIFCHFPLKSKEMFEYQKLMIALPPFSTITINFNSPVKFRGMYKCGVEKIGHYDFLKLFRFTKKIEAYEQMKILPRQIVPDIVIDDNDSDSESLSHNTFSLEKNSLASVREYRREDTVKHIHWKMSAKQDKLMVRDFEKSAGGTSIVIADLNEYFPFNEDNLLACDSVIETVIALNLVTMGINHSCLNLWYNNETEKCEQYTVKNAEQFLVFFNAISELGRQKETFLPESIADSCSDIPYDCSTVYFVTSQIRRDFISKISQIDLFKNKTVKILLIDTSMQSDSQHELAAAVAQIRGMELWNIDASDIKGSLEKSIQLYKKQ